MKSTYAIVFFMVSYLLFIVFPKKRSWVAVGAAILLVLSGTLSFREAFGAINWNVMGIFLGMLPLAEIFIKSKIPAYIAEIIVDRSKNTCWAILWLCALTGFISAFVENVATVLIIAPIALTLAKKINLNPMNMIIAIAICSNLQGAATLIGDPPSMLLGGFAKMNFMDFFFYQGNPSIFFAVEFGAFVSFFVLMFIFRKNKQKVSLIPIEKVQSWIPGIILVLLILLLAVSSFFDSGFSYMAGILCMIFGGIALLWEKWVHKGSVWKLVQSLDWDTTFFLLGIFVVVGSVTSTGWIDIIAKSLAGWVGDNIFLAFTLIVFISVILSAFVDNVPFLAAMLPVGIIFSNQFQISPSLFLFGLLIGASLGGNITPIGASANIVACGLLKKEGIHVSFKEFLKIGLPFTLAAVISAYLFIWFVWGKS